MAWDRLRVSHFGGPVAIVALAVSTIQMFVSSRIPLALNALLSVVIILVLVFSVTGLLHHAKRLCPECAVRLPLNCEAQAVRRERRLSFIHTVDDHRKHYVVLIVVLIVLSINTGIIGFIAGLVLNLTGMYLILSSITHSRLQPWCPWCREGGNDKHVSDLTPRDNQVA